jgi:PAS domain S-box-containing protein
MPASHFLLLDLALLSELGRLPFPGWVSLLCVLALGACLIVVRRAQRLQSEAERQLKVYQEAEGAAEQRWKLLFEQSPLSIQIFAPDGQTQQFNRAWSELFRLSDEMGYAFNVLQAPDLIASGAVDLIRLAFEGQPVTVPPVPFPVNTEPSETRWIGGVLYPVKDREGRLLEVVVIHHDVTDTKRAEDAMLAINQTLEQKVTERTKELDEARAELSRALEQERELGELKGRFVSMVSHEFRTPLGVTMSALELLTHYDDKLPAAQKSELLQDIRTATNSMVGMMEQVLLLGRADAGKLGFSPREIQLEVLLKKIAAEAAAASRSSHEIIWSVANDLHGSRGDEPLLRHIFSNLISNAFKYSPPESKVEVMLSRRGRDALCRVIDHGIGIPEKDRAHLFEAFHRCENVGDSPGTGLGLVIVKRCVEIHGGNIVFDSKVGHGTEFEVCLPLFLDSSIEKAT